MKHRVCWQGAFDVQTVGAKLLQGRLDHVDFFAPHLATFADASLVEIEGAGLFSHEEKPAEVAAGLLPVLVGDA